MLRTSRGCLLLVASAIAGGCGGDLADDAGTRVDTAVDADADSGGVDTDAADADARDGALDAADAADAADTTPFDPFAPARDAFVLPEEPPPEPFVCPALVNPGAETGDLAGWQIVRGSFTAQHETGLFDGNFPSAYVGDYYFRAGDSDNSQLKQDVAVWELMPSADDNATDDNATDDNATDDTPVWAVLDAWVRDYKGDDRAFVGLAALDANGTVLAARERGPFTDRDWRHREVALELPPGTHTVRALLRGQLDSGDDNDAYFDDVGLCLFDARPRAHVDELRAPPYLMNVTPTAVTVMFETRAAELASVEFGSTEALGHVISDPAPVGLHQLRLEGLTPGTRHYYKVRWGDEELPIYDFLTAPPADSDARVELIMIGDNQDGPAVFSKLSRLMATYDPDLLLHGGDCVQTGDRGEYRDHFFKPLFGLGNRTPMVMAMGNHETYSFAIVTSQQARDLWDEYVDQPGDEHCFGVRYGPLYIMVIDTERRHMVGSPQYACVEAALTSEEAQSATFRVALFHRPPLTEWWDSVAGFSSPVTFFAAGMDAPDVRDSLAPLFERTHVQLVFNGHNHLYQLARHYPQHVTWVTAGGAGGTLESGVASSRVNDWSEYVVKTIIGEHHFLQVVVDHGLLAVRAIGEDGEELDRFIVEP